MRLAGYSVLLIWGCGHAFAQEVETEPAAAVSSYHEAVACAGKFRWVLDASSGGQPVLNEYSLEERVEGVSAFTRRAEAAASDGDQALDVARDIQAVADDTIGVFFEDPDSVEADLMVCAIEIGMREG